MIFEYVETSTINDTNESKEYWINQDFIPQNLKTKLKNSNVLFIPEERKGEMGFYSDTLPFLEYLEKVGGEQINPNICMDENDYQEFILHSDVIRIGKIIIEYIILPIFANYLYDYLKNKFFNPYDEDKIEITLNIQKNNKNTEFEYRGSFEDFQELIHDKKFIEMFEGSEE